MNLPITDPTDINLRFALLSGNIFLGRDKRSKCYMRAYRSMQAK